MSELSIPLRGFYSEAAWLQSEFGAAVQSRMFPNQLQCEMCVVRLHDAWARFCRELIITSALGKTLTISGVVLIRASGISTRITVIPQLMGTFRRRRNEPNWYDATDCIDAAQRLGLTNLTTIGGALGSVNSPADSIRKVRNFYAHRGSETALKAGSTGIFSKPSAPDVFELAGFSAHGMTHFETWVLGLKTIAQAATL